MRQLGGGGAALRRQFLTRPARPKINQTRDLLQQQRDAQSRVYFFCAAAISASSISRARIAAGRPEIRAT
jgi:hypothetical protein